jgi:hypothetical protein
LFANNGGQPTFASPGRTGLRLPPALHAAESRHLRTKARPMRLALGYDKPHRVVVEHPVNFTSFSQVSAIPLRVVP